MTELFFAFLRRKANPEKPKKNKGTLKEDKKKKNIGTVNPLKSELLLLSQASILFWISHHLVLS